ncbi:LeuA family protein [Rhizobium sp.]|jgi:2-isopropylmalate synthase|uniref:LeuA family protein n=1 Tax=Rhizobium sp. TaxID=391 RepID=UPI000E9FE1D8|nr:pyruvate carboxyltransferase [Rhizobium sp.]
MTFINNEPATLPTPREVFILDTTLRDGEQAPGNAMRIDQKLAIADALEESGVDYIETGFPASSPEDAEATRLIAKRLSQSGVATFCRPVASDIQRAVDCAGTGANHLLMLVATSSDLHLERKRGITREQGVEEVRKAISVATELGVSNLAVGLEDASRASFEYLEELAKTSISSGAKEIILADTTGYATPEAISSLIKHMRQVVGADVRLSIHCHDDLGLAVANSVAALLAGADCVQATLGGIGERAGNASLEQIAAILACKEEEYGLKSRVKLGKLYAAFNLLRDAINLDEPRTRPLFGRYAFATAAGIHQQGILNDPDTYEYVKPALVGRSREMLVSRHSGRSIIRYVIAQLGYTVCESDVDMFYNRYVIGEQDVVYREVDTLSQLIASDFRAQRMELRA